MPDIERMPRVVAPGDPPGSVDMHLLPSGHVVQQVDCGDVRIRIVLTPEEAMMLGVAHIKLSGVIEREMARAVKPASGIIAP